MGAGRGQGGGEHHNIMICHRRLQGQARTGSEFFFVLQRNAVHFFAGIFSSFLLSSFVQNRAKCCPFAGIFFVLSTQQFLVQNRAKCCPFFGRNFFASFLLSKFLCKTGRNAVHFLAGIFLSSFLLSNFLCKAGRNAVHFLAGFFLYPFYLANFCAKQGEMLSIFWQQTLCKTGRSAVRFCG